MRPQVTYNRLQSLAFALNAYRQAAAIDAYDGECAASYDDACDDLGYLSADAIACATAIVATDPAAWSVACDASEATGESNATLPYMLARCIVAGEDNDVPAALLPLLACTAAARWRDATARDSELAAERAACERKENEEKDEN